MLIFQGFPTESETLKLTWTNDYVGIPFSLDGRTRDGLDCWGLVCLVYQEQHGVTIPSYEGVFRDNEPGTMLTIHKLMIEQRKQWRVVGHIKPFDLISLRTGRHAFHVGLAVDAARFIHADDKAGACIIEGINSPLWANRIECIHRHNSLA